VVWSYGAGPRTFTGEDTLEISTHGNPLIVQLILADLFMRGCRAAEPGEFTRRAFLNGRMELTQAEAVMDLIHARSERALVAAQQQLRGGLGRHLEELIAALLEVLARIEAYIDFPDEDLPVEDKQLVRTALADVLRGTERLLATRRYGDLLRDGLKTVLLGAPNVGKSSLVNFMVNRKALASTSATPGHTTQFHFFAVNSGRTDLPSFRLVDVPGLGYAEADEGQQDSWRSLLERYLTVRDSLHMVFHLVDSRHKLTAVDQQMMVMATRAAATRKDEQRTPLRFAVVLTKTDRASEKALRESIADVKQGTKELAAVLGVESVPILLTSSVARQGRDELWRLLIESLSLSYAKQ
jgi:ribosome biogenesis GTP-binding protein YsxC/EngB